MRLTARGGSRVWVQIAAFAALAAAAASSSALAAGTPTAAPALVDLSGASPFPFPPECGIDDTQSRDAEEESTLAISPIDPRNVAAAWIEDPRESDIVSSSHDGGRSFTRVLVPGFSRCTGGGEQLAADPWLSFGRDGALYFSGLAYDLIVTPAGLTVETAAIELARSEDGGLSWSRPVIVRPADGYNDKPSTLVDAADPRRVFLAYSRRFGADYENGQAYIVRSDDSGRDWHAPVLVYDPGPTRLATGQVLTAGPDGCLVDVFLVTNRFRDAPGIGDQVASAVPGTLVAARSIDGGTTWSAPVTISTLPNVAPLKDPDTGNEIGGTPFPSVATDRDGTLLVTWTQTDRAGSSRIRLGRSRDAGRSWASSAVSPAGGQAFLPAVATSPNGAIGISYYDTRNDRPGDRQWTADYWLSRSSDGLHWSDTHVAGPLDLRSDTSRFGLGDYQALAPEPDGFGAAFALAKPFAEVGPSDVFFAQAPGVANRSEGRRPPSAGPARLRLAVRPTRTRIGLRTRFVFTAATVDPHRVRQLRSVRRVSIRVGRRRVLTNRHGRAVVMLRFTRPGPHRATATKTGYVSAGTVISVF